MTKHEAKRHLITAVIVISAFSFGVAAERSGSFDEASKWVEKKADISLPWV